MNLVKWDTFKEREDVSNRLNRICWRPLARAESGTELLAMADWSPSADITETESAYLIKAEIPGVKREDIKVTIQDGMLTMQGERKKEEKGKKFRRIERSYGCFSRSSRMPDDVDENSVKAEFKDGMLNITLAKSEKTKPKSINVSVS